MVHTKAFYPLALYLLFKRQYGKRARTTQSKEHYVNTGNQNTPLSNEFPVESSPYPLNEQSSSLLSPSSDWKAYTFRSTASSLYTLLTENIEEKSLSQNLQTNIHHLQDCFLERLYTLLEHYVIDGAQKITLRLADGKHLVICNEHPEQDTIQNLLSASPDLSEIFSEMAMQSLVLRELTLLQTITLQYITHQPICPSPGTPMYHLNIKGDMNHFFFVTL